MKDYQAPKDVLAGRIILVTGASDGIGRAAALTFAEHGATVVLLGRTQAKLEKVYDEIERRGAPQPAIVPLDLARATTENYDGLFQTLDREFGRLDGLLHNAADLGTLTPVEFYEPEVWARVLQVNATAPFLITRACLPLLKRSSDASVVFTTADVGRKGRAYWGAYGVSAFAMEGLMQILADELEVNTAVRVNSLDPGPVHTHMRVRAYPGEDHRRHPEPEAIMPSYLYLLGPASKGITGQALSAQ